MESLKIVLMGKDFELRLVSLVVRARELANEVSVIDLGSTDDTVNMAKKVDCEVTTHMDDILVPTLSGLLLQNNNAECTLLIHITRRFKLRDMPLLVNRAKENWDVHMSFSSEESENSNPFQYRSTCSQIQKGL